MEEMQKEGDERTEWGGGRLRAETGRQTEMVKRSEWAHLVRVPER